jgi:hypothetical protein
MEIDLGGEPVYTPILLKTQDDFNRMTSEQRFAMHETHFHPACDARASAKIGLIPCFVTMN